jgi:capsular exopolysaccharide synthesis family protein
MLETTITGPLMSHMSADTAIGVPSAQVRAVQQVTSFFYRHKLLIGCVAVGVMLIFVGIIAGVKPKYTADVTILIDPRRAKDARLNSQPEDERLAEEIAIQNALQTLQSKKLARELIEPLGLRSDPDYNPVLRPHGVVYKLMHDFVLAERQWLPPVVNDFLTPRFAPELLDNVDDLIVTAIEKNLRVTRDGKSQNVIVGFSDQKPRRAASIVNKYTELFVDDETARKGSDIEQLSLWINKRLEELRERTKITEERVENYRRENRLLKGKDLPGVQKITELTSQFTAAVSAHDQAVAKAQQAESAVSTGQLDAVEEIQRSPLIQQLRLMEGEVLRRIAVQTQTLGEQHLKLVESRADITEVRRKIIAEAQRILQTLRTNVAVTSKQVAAIDAELKDAKLAVAEENMASVELRALERDAADARTLLDGFLTHAKLTTENNLHINEARVTSAALVPTTSDFPNLLAVLAIGAAASLSVGVTVALYADYRNRGFRSTDDIQPQLNLPALSLIPWAPRAATLPLTKPWSPYVESIRQLYTGLLFTDARHGAILFTSSISKEGKTTVAVSFARTLALASRSVILLDSDTRRPTTHKVLNVPCDRGLANVLAGTADIQDVIRIDTETGLHFLTAGHITANPAFRLEPAEIGGLIQTLSARYETVVIDGPPLLPVSDTRLLARYVDKAVLILRWEETPRNTVRLALGYLQQSGVKIAGVIINGVIPKRYASCGFSDSGLYWRRASRAYYHRK